MSPNSLVDHQMLVVCVQNAFEIKLGHLELLELSFGSVDPIFFNNNQVDVLVNPLSTGGGALFHTPYSKSAAIVFWMGK